ncbi:hypothetical protein CEP54_012288 [Fusarium duplospermum]|uniref:Uncharacterized protein n=1 Tax=Fusarium duplospermum TaxID=1325734 RepID=A0A428P9P1_9HYPO|nr:hypothetical protein CEP54_012288 [Fusarium duplospermum]
MATSPTFSSTISNPSNFTRNVFAQPQEAIEIMPPPPTQTQLQRRRSLEIAKRQFTFLVSIMATIFTLCPECLRVYRNLCIVPALAWLIGLAFDLIESLSNTWDNAPPILKYFIPDVNIRFEAPFEQINTSVGPLLSKGSREAKLIALEARTRIMAIRKMVLLVLANWILRQLGQDPVGENSPGRSEDGTPGPAPVSDKWYEILVMTPPVHDYGSLPLDPDARPPSDPIPWDSRETSSVPSIFPPTDFRVHLSFCLVPKAVWESQDTTLTEKFKAGLYWDMTGENRGDNGEVWTQKRVQRIAGIETLGLVDEEQDAVISCHAYFASLRRGWRYVNLSWNDVDFAIILGFLVVGPPAARSTTDLFTRFSTLRINQVLGARQMVRENEAVSLWWWMYTVAGTVVPLIGLFAALETIKMWNRRIAYCRVLQRRFPQLEELFRGMKAEQWGN